MNDEMRGVRVYSIPETIERLGIGRDNVYRAIREGLLVARKYGKRTLILESDLEAFLKSLPRLFGDKAA